MHQDMTRHRERPLSGRVAISLLIGKEIAESRSLPRT